MAEETKNNLDWYNQFAPCPENALSTIQAGKLKGKSDINPMWRIKTLTEKFGPVGFGWYTEIKERWVDEFDGEAAAWVICNLYVKHPETGEWSKPITGTGGSKLSGKGKGDGVDDEAYKMAETDAISVCCKKLGLAANIYWQKDVTKYSDNKAQEKAADFFRGQQQPLPRPQRPAPMEPAEITDLPF